MKCAIFTKEYRGIPVTAFWMRPNDSSGLIYGYQLKDGDLEIMGTGFRTSTAACRHAALVIDDLLALPVCKARGGRRGSRASGTNPRAMGTNPRALRDSKKDQREGLSIAREY